MIKKWNGWGWQEIGFNIDLDYVNLIPSLEKLFEQPLEKIGSPIRAEQIKIPESRITGNALKQLCLIIPEKYIKRDHSERLFHSRGRSLPDLFSLRNGTVNEFPDVVIYPQNNQQIIHLLKFAQKFKMAVIPYGGGTSVVGGINSIKVKLHNGIIILNLTNMNKMLKLDEVSQTARFQCGILGPELEILLNKSGYTLGHFPQSFEFSTLGGWVATRGAGYLSDKYGKIEDMIVSLQICLPDRFLETEISSEIAEGPLLTQIFTGSEGTMGIITEIIVKIKPLPDMKKQQAFLFSSFNDAIQVMREGSQKHIAYSMVRLSDYEETQYYRLLNLKNNGREKLKNFLLNSLGYQTPCLMLIITDGHYARMEMHKISKIVKKQKCIQLGSGPVESWYASRYKTPYIRDYLLDFGVASDTFETWVNWSDLEKLKTEIYLLFDKLRLKMSKKYLLMSHVSHISAQGVCIYFTVLYLHEKKNPVNEYEKLKSQITNTLLKNNGALSHHHGVGTDHKLYMKGDEQHKAKCKIMENLKKELDPAGILNPGKLF